MDKIATIIDKKFEVETKLFQKKDLLIMILSYKIFLWK